MTCENLSATAPYPKGGKAGSLAQLARHPIQGPAAMQALSVFGRGYAGLRFQYLAHPAPRVTPRCVAPWNHHSPAENNPGSGPV